MYSAGWTAGRGPILSHRADPPTSMLIWSMNTRSSDTMPAMNIGIAATRIQR